MSNYSEIDFCTQDEGLDYVFGRMMAIFGAPFNRHFDGIDPGLVRDEWKNQLGRFLTYRPSMDYGISMLDGEFIPSAIKFRKLCNAGPSIPVKPERTLEYNPSKMSDEQKNDVREQLRKLREEYANRQKRNET